jgi:Tripartite tricarboxylate transporter TctB family
MGKLRRDCHLKVRPQAILSFVFLIFFIVFVYQAQDWRLQARLYPLAIGIPMLILAIIQVILDLRGVKAKETSDGAPVDFQLSQNIDPVLARKRAINIFSWIFGFFLLIWLLGFPIAIAAMMFGYLKIQSKEPWVLSIVLTAVGWICFWVLFVWLLNLPFPQGLILEWLGVGS